MEGEKRDAYRRHKEFIRDYANRYFYLCINKRKEGDRLIGQNSIRFLLLTLQRSRYLFESFSLCVKHRHQSAAYLTVRAHFEVTGMIAYYYKKIQQFYTGEIDYDEMATTLRGLTLGGRTFPESDNELEKHIPKAVNVLTLINEADRLFNSMAKEKVNCFRSCYDFLSEFCHPNYLGLTIGHNIVDWNACAFSKKQVFEEEKRRLLISNLNISATLFFPIYDKCFAIVKERESKDMPILLKNYSSAIWTLLKLKPWALIKELVNKRSKGL